MRNAELPRIFKDSLAGSKRIHWSSQRVSPDICRTWNQQSNRATAQPRNPGCAASRFSYPALKDSSIAGRFRDNLILQEASRSTGRIQWDGTASNPRHTVSNAVSHLARVSGEPKPRPAPTSPPKRSSSGYRSSPNHCARPRQKTRRAAWAPIPASNIAPLRRAQRLICRRAEKGPAPARRCPAGPCGGLGQLSRDDGRPGESHGPGIASGYP